MSNLRLLKNLYVDLILLIIIMIVLTPYLVVGGFLFLQESLLEGVIILFLFLISYIIYLFYQRELEQATAQLEAITQDNNDLQSRIDESFRYIGALNVQVDQMEDVFSAIKKYPENKKDLKAVLEFLAEKILSMVNTKWVLLRIVNLDDNSTIREYCGVRAGAPIHKLELSNKDLLGDKLPDDLLVHRSDQDNLSIKAFCIFPQQDLSREQSIFLKAIANQLEMLFIVFTSPYILPNHKCDVSPAAAASQTRPKKKRSIFSFPARTAPPPDY